MLVYLSQITDSVVSKSVLSKISVYIKSSEVPRHIGTIKSGEKTNIETETFNFVDSVLIKNNWHYTGMLCSKRNMFSS